MKTFIALYVIGIGCFLYWAYYGIRPEFAQASSLEAAGEHAAATYHLVSAYGQLIWLAILVGFATNRK